MRVTRQRFTSNSLERRHLHSRKLPYERLFRELETNVLRVVIRDQKFRGRAENLV